MIFVKSKRIRFETITFILIGIVCFCIEWCVYYSVFNFISDLIISKLVGIIVGTISAFILNTFITFKSKITKKNIFRYTLTYLITISINVIGNKYFVLFLYLYLDKLPSLFISFILFTGISSVMNFIAMKYWVYK